MIEILRRIQRNLTEKENLTWQDVATTFYGQGHGYRDARLIDVDFGILVDSDLPEIISIVERNGKLRYFPIRGGAWTEGEEHFGFTHHLRPVERAYPHIQGRKPISASFLSSCVTRELDPTIGSHEERMDRIESGLATRNPYKYLLSMEAGDINPRPLFTETFDGLL